MAAGVRPVSLKRGGVWGGLSEVATLERAPGTFSRLENAYLSKDGSEIRRWPGSALCGRPVCGEPINIASGTRGTSETVIVLGRDHNMKELGGPARFVWIAGNADIPDGLYAADREADDSLRVLVNTGSGALATDGYVWVHRLQHVHALHAVYGRPVLVCETQVFVDSGTEERRNVGSWVGQRPLSIASPEEPGVPDTTDTGFIFWRSPTMLAIASEEGEDDIWHMEILGRIHGDTINGRLCLAVPGHGHCWQVDLERDKLGINAQQNATVPEHRYTKLLGIPKGLLDVDSVELEPLSVTPFTAWLANGEHIWVSVGYMDTVTGEVGLASPPVKITNTTTDNKFPEITVLKPRGVLKEAVGLAVVLYASEVGGVADLLYPVEIYGPFAASADNSHDFSARFAIIVNRAPDPDYPVGPRRFPSIEQMQPGASALAVVKARLCVAGERPDVSRVGIFTTRFTYTLPDETSATVDLISFNDEDVAGATLIDARAAGYRLPQTYAASPLSHEGPVVAIEPDGSFNPPSTKGFQVGTLVEKLNMQTSTSGFATRRENWVYSQPVGVMGSGSNDEGVARLLVRPNIMAYSEEARPGIAPASNRIPVDIEDGQRVTALGPLGESLLVFTDTSTLLYQYGAAPRPAGAVTLSTRYGCISQKSVVEGPDGTYWLSREGPCLTAGGGVQCFGDAVYETWRTLKRDSEGMMPFAHGVYDRDRRLIVWSLRGPDDLDEDWSVLTTDTQKAKVPQDLLLVFHVPTRSFSLVKRGHSGVLETMALMPMADGLARVCYVSLLSSDEVVPDVYAWHDDYGERHNALVGSVATADKEAGAAAFFIGSPAPALGAGDGAYVVSPTGELRWFGLVAVPTATGCNLDDVDGAVWYAGDELVGPVVHMHLSTQRLKLSDIGMNDRVTGIELRAKRNVPASVASASTYTVTPQAWVRLRVEDQDGVIVALTKGWGEVLNDGGTRFNAGSMRGHDLIVHVDIIANCQVILEDIVLQVARTA